MFTKPLSFQIDEEGDQRHVWFGNIIDHGADITLIPMYS